MNGDCGMARGHLDAFLNGDLAPDVRRDVARHLEQCPQCAAEFDACRRLKEQLQAAVRATPVPPDLESRVRGAVRRQASRPRSGLWAIAAAAALVACITLVGLWRSRGSPEQAIMREAAQLPAIVAPGLLDHLQCAVFRTYPKKPDPARQMAADLGPAFAQLAPMVAAKLPADFQLIQAHLDPVQSREFTHFIIAGDNGKLVSLLLTRKLPGESVSGIRQAGIAHQAASPGLKGMINTLLRRPPDGQVYHFQIVWFESHDYIAYLISDLDAWESLQWATNLAPAVRDFFEWRQG